MKRTTKTETMLQQVRKKQLDEMKSMTSSEKSAYIRRKAEHCKKRVASIKEKEKEVRSNQVLIRLTVLERQRLEQDAHQENTTVSDLVRSRALCEKTPFNTILSRLNKIESALRK